MSIQLSISDVRKELYLAAGGPGVQQAIHPANLLLGRIFKESFAKLFGNDRRLNWRSAIAGAVPQKKEWQTKIEEHVFKRLIGPQISREQAHLHERTEQVVAFWQAARSLCHWLVAHLWRARRQLASRTDIRFKLLVPSEASLSLEFKEEGWTDSVILTGIADFVINIPGKKHWCIVELNLGPSCPQADMAQMCLYHQILSAHYPGSAEALVLVEFKPHKEEHIFNADDFRTAQKRLMNLIGRLAGVTPGNTPISRRPPTGFFTIKDRQKCFEQGRRLVAIFRKCVGTISLAGDPRLDC